MNIDQLNCINQQTLSRINEFRKEKLNFKDRIREHSILKHKFPYFGYVSCRSGLIDFLLFHANDDVVAWDYLWFGDDAYEKEIISVWLEWCREPSLVYDVGAYTGVMSVLAALSNSETNIHLFEPIDRTVERAKINIRSNGIGKQVKLHNKAVSDRGGSEKINLYRNEDFLGTGNSIYNKDIEVVDEKTIQCVMLDEHLPELSPTIVKIDVEGHELACLIGMKNTLRRSKPKMIIEVWEHTRNEVLGFLNELGYQCVPFEKTESRVMNFKCTPVGV